MSPYSLRDNIQKNKTEIHNAGVEAEIIKKQIDEANGTKVKLIKDLKVFRQVGKH